MATRHCGLTDAHVICSRRYCYRKKLAAKTPADVPVQLTNAAPSTHVQLSDDNGGYLEVVGNRERSDSTYEYLTTDNLAKEHPYAKAHAATP